MQKILQVPLKVNTLKITAFSLLFLMISLFTNTAKCQVYDLALINGISTDFSTHYCPGDEVRFNTVLYNSGDIEACNVQITAYIPAGMSASSNPLNSIWTVNGSTATANISTCIPPGGVYPNAESGPLSAFLVLELNNPPSSTITFYSEISQDDGDDIDSTPDNNPNNDAVIEGLIYSSNDEDDHDLTTIVVREDCVSLGCIDPCAPNYDSTATQDDGSCAAYSTICNSDICAGDVAVWNPDTCGCQVTTVRILGCTDPEATNYNASANCNEGNCMAPAPPPPTGDYDLALITGISSSYPGTYCPGEEVRFNTVVYNTGDIEACQVEITAYIPEGMSVSSNPLNSIWTINGNTATANITSCIPPGGVYPNADSDILSSFLVLEITSATASTVNFYAEISMDDGNDIDSMPDNDPTNDAGGIPNSDTDNAIYNPNDEDDHDVASINVCDPVEYDLALVTDIAAGYNSTVNPGEEVGFSTTVYNQGDEQACNVEVTAYIPAGMELSSNPLNSIWTVNGSTATTTINTCIAPNGAELVNIYLTLVSGAAGSMINFYAEISQDDGDDIDSMPDNNVNNDPGAIPNSNTDGVINGENGDEDDHDVAAIVIGNPGVYDLALIAGISSSYDTVYCPGEEVRFNVVVYNTGEVEACSFEITAYIPAGMSVSDNDLNSIWTVNGSIATATINTCIPPGGTYPNASTDPLSAFLILEISGAPGTMVNFYAEISMDDGDDIDSTPDNNPNNDAGAVPNTDTDNSIYNPADEDDHDVAAITICEEEIYDLALITTLAPGYNSVVNVGDEVGFSTTVYNQGEVQACNVEVTAYIPVGMSLSNNPLNSIWTVDGYIATTTINSCIEPGGAASVNIYLTLDAEVEGANLNFYAEISMDDGEDIDSTADGMNDDPGAIPNSGTDNTINGEMGDEDDHDVAAITIGEILEYDLALVNGISSSLPTEYCPGDEVRYNTAIYNTGEITACNVQITAYIPEGMSVSDNPQNSIWTINGSVATTNITSCIPPGGVYPNPDSDLLSAFLILEIDNAPNSVLNFYSEISMDDGNDKDSNADSDPNNDPGAIPGTNSDNAIYNQNGDEDDHDVASISVDADCGGFRVGRHLPSGHLSIENIYPTIANNFVNVVITASSKASVLFQIVDLNGVVVYSQTNKAVESANVYQMNIDFLKEGVYLLHAIKGNEIATHKFVVE